jgi:hypothetical protein
MPEYFAGDTLDPQELVPRARTAHDRDPAECHARPARDQPAERVVGLALERWRRHAHEHDAFTFPDDLGPACAWLETDAQVGGPVDAVR